MKRFWVGVLPVVVWAGGVQAQTPRDTGAVVIRTARLFDSESGSMRSGQDILVRNGQIVQVGPGLEVPANARVIDLRNYTVLPGLIDAHTHLLYLESPKSTLTLEGVKAVAVEGIALRALHGAARARTFLQAGITTVRDLGNSGRFGDVALRYAILDGSVDGPRMFVSGPGLSPVGGQFPGVQPAYQAMAEEEYRIVRNPQDAADAVRENITFGAQVIKIFSNNTPNPGVLTPEELRAIVETARMMRVRVAAHATNDAAVWRAAEAGVHSIDHGYQIADSTLALMKQNNVMLVPTDSDSVTTELYLKQAGTYSPENLRATLRQTASLQERLRRAMAAGVTIAAGSDQYLDLGIPQGQAARRVLFAYHEAGMPASQVLQAATITNARLLGMEGRLGVIKQGALADIIAVEGDPLADFNATERVRFVMKAGTVYVGRSLAN